MSRAEFLERGSEPDDILKGVDAILRIHRGPDGYISFGRKVDDDGWENLPAIRVDQLQTMFPAVADQLTRDSYLSLNTFFTPKRDVHRRYLNACWVDIDLHQPGEIQTLGQRHGEILDAVQAGTIPRPSVTVYSGRGMWVLWLLVEQEDSDTPPRAFPEKFLAQEEINRRLAQILHADPMGSTVQLIRIPGSTNMKAEPGHEVVRYRFLLDLDGNRRGEVYTLSQLAAAVAVELPTLRESRRGPRSAKSARGLVGWKALYAQRLAAFRRLWEIRGGFSEGCRNRAAYYYGTFLRGYRVDEKTTWKEMERFGSQCRPPLSRGEIYSAFTESKKGRGQIRNNTISRHLMVTEEEGRTVPEWAPEQFKGKVEPRDMAYSNYDRIALRKESIRQIVEELGRPVTTISCRTLARLLAERGQPISHMQVSRYIREMRTGSKS